MDGGRGTKFWAVARKNSTKIILSTDFYIVLPSVFDDLDLGLLQGGLCQINPKSCFQSLVLS